MTTLALMFVFLALAVFTILLSFGKMFVYLQQNVILYHLGLGIVVFDALPFNLSGFSKCSCAYTFVLQTFGYPTVIMSFRSISVLLPSFGFIDLI